MTMTRTAATDWPAIIAAGRAWVERHDMPVTLRQTYYALVAAGKLRNREDNYRVLVSRIAEARRRGQFPNLIDEALPLRRIENYVDADAFTGEAVDLFRLDRTIGQHVKVILGAEKIGIAAQLLHFYGDPHGLPVIVVDGSASPSVADDLAQSIVADGRPAALLYAGDLNLIGEDVVADFVRRVGKFAEVTRVAVTAEQVKALGVPPRPGPTAGRRAGPQPRVEVEALDPDDLRHAFTEALAPLVDAAALRNVCADEQAQRDELRRRRASR